MRLYGTLRLALPAVTVALGTCAPHGQGMLLVFGLEGAALRASQRCMWRGVGINLATKR